MGSEKESQWGCKVKRLIDDHRCSYHRFLSYLVRQGKVSERPRERFEGRNRFVSLCGQVLVDPRCSVDWLIQSDGKGLVSFCSEYAEEIPREPAFVKWATFDSMKWTFGMPFHTSSPLLAHLQDTYKHKTLVHFSIIIF